MLGGGLLLDLAQNMDEVAEVLDFGRGTVGFERLAEFKLNRDRVYQKTIVFLEVVKLEENVSFAIVESVLGGAFTEITVLRCHGSLGQIFN